MKKIFFIFLSLIGSSFFLFDDATGALSAYRKHTIIKAIKAMDLNDKIEKIEVNEDLGSVEFKYPSNSTTYTMLNATPLALSIEINDTLNNYNLNRIKDLLKKDANVFHEYTITSANQKNPNVKTPIQILAYDSNLAQELADWLIRNTKINDFIDADHNTIAHAFATDDANIFGLKELLISQVNQVNPEIINKNGKTPLHIALESKAYEIAEAFIRGTNIDLTKIYSYKTKENNVITESLFTTVTDIAIRYSLENLHYHTIDDNIVRLKKHNAKLDLNGNTLMHHLASEESIGMTYLEIISDDDYKPLLSDLDSKNNDEETPLYTACRRNNFEIVEKLITLGATPLIVAKNGTSVLHVAVGNAVENLEILTYLLEKTDAKNLINKADTKNKTPIQKLIDLILKKTVINENYNKIIKLLLEYGAKKEGLVDTIKHSDAYKTPNRITPLDKIIKLINDTNSNSGMSSSSTGSSSSSSSGAGSSSSHTPSSPPQKKAKKTTPPLTVKKAKDPLTKQLSTLTKKLTTLKEKLKDLAANLGLLKTKLGVTK